LVFKLQSKMSGMFFETQCTYTVVQKSTMQFLSEHFGENCTTLMT